MLPVAGRAGRRVKASIQIEIKNSLSGFRQDFKSWIDKKELRADLTPSLCNMGWIRHKIKIKCSKNQPG